MKKITCFLVALAVCCFFSQHVFAELPDHVKVSDTQNEYWYYIQNTINHTEKGTASFRTGAYMTSFGGGELATVVRGSHLFLSKGRDYQLWKIVESSEATGLYYIINKASGYPLALGAGSEAAGAESQSVTPKIGSGYNDRYYTASEVGTEFEISKFIGHNGEIWSDKYISIRRAEGENKSLLSLYGQNSLLSIYDQARSTSYEAKPATMTDPLKNPRGWAFIPEAEGNDRYPKLSTASENFFYTIKSASATFAEKFITAISDGETAGVSDKSEEAKANQEWMFLPVESTNPFCDSVYVISRGTGLYLSKEGKTVSNPAPVVLNHLLADDNQFRFLPYSGDTLKLNNSSVLVASGAHSTFIAKKTDEDIRLAEVSASNYVYGSDGAFTLSFTEHVVSSVSNHTAKNIGIYSDNGYIFVKGTDSTPVVYTLQGYIVDASVQLKKGCYIVAVDGEAFKVLVK